MKILIGKFFTSVLDVFLLQAFFLLSPIGIANAGNQYKATIGFEGQQMDFNIAPGKGASPTFVMPKPNDPSIDSAIPTPRSTQTKFYPIPPTSSSGQRTFVQQTLPISNAGFVKYATSAPASSSALNFDGNNRIVLHDIKFDSGKSDIKDESVPALEGILSILTGSPDVKITIEGHTDSNGNEDVNQQLSLERADSIRSWLIGQGVDPGRVKTAGYGASRPIASNDTEDGQQMNRRVEIVKE
ncbi:MAG: OmpA family protein [Candidatus Riflebacteria bacterium]|nr:OmpA family protein [Candidatus Riflebacteria bacterium]